MTAEVSFQELVQVMNDTAFQFECCVLRGLTDDGSKDEVFETWREAFYEAFDHPDDEQRKETADATLRAVLS